MRILGKTAVLIPSVMAFRETAMTAPLDQQGEPLAAIGRLPCLSLWERCPAGAERARFPSQSLRDSSPRVGAKGDEVAPNFTENHPKTHWCGSTYGSLV